MTNGRHGMPNPLVLHGPPGTGKTHLMTGLLAAIAGAGRTGRLIPATDLIQAHDAVLSDADPFQGARACDLLIVEDLQFLPPRAAEPLTRLVDYRLSHRLQTVFTACAGPGRLTDLAPRLASRLAGGLVVAVGPLSAASRRLILQALADRRRLTVEPEALGWLADHLTGGVRPLLGALSTLKSLAAGSPIWLGLETVRCHWAASDLPPVIDRIVQGVADWYRLSPKHLRGRARQPGTLRPCQVAIFLARELTPLPLAAIGDHFGGRDAGTVRHACRKIAAASDGDPAVAATLRHLRAALSTGGKSR